MSRRFVGEGELSALDVLGGKPIVVWMSAVPVFGVAFGAIFGVLHGPAASVVPLALATFLVALLGARLGFWRPLASVLRGAPRPRFRVELDDLTVRHSDRGGATIVFDWFEIERYAPIALGLVLWLRAPKDGANCVILPRRFFAPEDWDALVALVREKLPSSAKQNDAAARPNPAARPWRTLLLWSLLIVLLYAVFQLTSAR